MTAAGLRFLRQQVFVSPPDHVIFVSWPQEKKITLSDLPTFNTGGRER